MKSELDALHQDLRDNGNQSRGKKEWKIALAAKVKSVLANEKLAQTEHDLDRLKPGLESGTDAVEIVKAQISSNAAVLNERARAAIGCHFPR